MPRKKDLSAAGEAVAVMDLGKRSASSEGKRVKTTVDITETREYLVLMSRDKGMSMGAYIRGLIEADMKKHSAKYAELKKNPPLG